MVVEKGNTIFVPAAEIDQRKFVIEWSQNLSSRKEDYYVCKYTVKESGTEDLIFIQASKLGEFKNKKTGDNEFTVSVDDSFQYGQNKEKTKRFLVYHDKNNKMYQHRFVENMLTKLGGRAVDLASLVGYKFAGNVEDLLKNFLGDYLRNF